MANPITSVLQYFSTIQSPISAYETTTDGYLKASIYGIPVFTYTLIAITTLTLAYVTLADNSEGEAPTESPSTDITSPFALSSPPQNPEFRGGKTRHHRKLNKKTHRKR